MESMVTMMMAGPVGWWLEQEVVLAGRLKVKPEMVRYLACLALIYPLVLLHRRMPTVASRHILALTVGLWLAWVNFGWDALHFVVSSTVTYLVTIAAPRQRLMPVAVFVFTMLYISAGHIERMYFGGSTLGGPVVHWTSPQMLLTIKMTSFAWAYYDAHRPSEELLPSQEQRAIYKRPSLLEYFSYIFFFAGFLTGPIAEYREYIEFTDRSMFSKEARGGRIPEGSIAAGFKRLLMALAAVPLFYVHQKFPAIYATTPQFLEHSIWYRWFYIIASSELGFDKYYVVFFLGEGTIMLSGLGYNGRDANGHALWDRLLMLRLIPFKTAQDPSTLASNWNIVSANWLKRYVYIRLLPARTTAQGVKSGAAPKKPLGFVRQMIPFFATFFVSAIWHGFYAGYYLFFLSLASFAALGRLNRMYIRPYFMAPDGRTGDYPKKYIYDAASLFCMVVGLNYHIVIFRTFTFENAMKVWSAFFFFPHILGLLAILFYAIALPTGLLRRPKPNTKTK